MTSPGSKARRTRTRERGAAAVEFALLLPFLLLIVFGIIDFGRMLNAQITLTEAAREGARAESLGSDADARVQATAGDLGTVTTDIDSPCPGSDDAVVYARHDFTFVTPLGPVMAIFGDDPDDTYSMTGKGVMPCFS